MLANPGFETGNLSGWSCASTDSVVTGHAHGGTVALQGAANNSDHAQYVFIGATGTGGSDPSTFTPGTGGAYTQLSVRFTTGGSTRSVTVFVHGWPASSWRTAFVRTRWRWACRPGRVPPAAGW